MFESILNIFTNPNFMALTQQWILAITSIVAAASAITALTPTKRDDKIRDYILSVLNFLALNIGNARNKDKNDAE